MENQTLPAPLKLFMVLLGSKAPQRTVEQHDYFFGIAYNLRDLVTQMQAFWPEAGNSLHIDGWREVNVVDGYAINVMPNKGQSSLLRLFFINLGGYQHGKLEEQHYNLLTVKEDKSGALAASKLTPFFKKSTIAKVKGANAHIDEKYGIDVDDVYRIEDVLTQQDKTMYHIQITPRSQQPDDEIHLGYFKLNKL
ncbi:DUF1543 domain-containing protein [Mucilaginibacter terrae]|uniref:DUF1543 domain-containing protein n=1 Tax=Mucilaginibacter terrae TaxID=1955052 RepID=A0ABU3H034_9SPHI|nr:DUF1543 domain-containing protein [Mucilaginibacter terrae]MDT3405280.1 hypothetical protein [Mucilaginibacter terrae]